MAKTLPATTEDPGFAMAAPLSMEERASLYDRMTPPLRKLAKQVDASKATVARGVAMVAREIGDGVARARQDGAYGVDALDLLSRYSGISLDGLRDCADIAGAFDVDQLTKLTQRQTVNGRHLTVSHIATLARVADMDERAELAERAFTEGLSYRELGDMAAGTTRRTSRSESQQMSLTTGRPITTKPLPAAVAEMGRLTGSFVRRVDYWTEHVLPGLEDDDEPVTQAMYEKAEEAVEKLKALGQEVAALRKRLGEVMPKVRERAAAPPAESVVTRKKKVAKKKAAKKKASKKKASKKKAGRRRATPEPV